MSRSRSKVNVRSLSPVAVEDEPETKQLLGKFKGELMALGWPLEGDVTQFEHVATAMKDLSEGENTGLGDSIKKLKDESKGKLEALKIAISLINDVNEKIAGLVTSAQQEPPLKKRRKTDSDYAENEKGKNTTDLLEAPIKGSQVAFRLRKYKGGEEEWIQCEVTKVFAEGLRYEVQDPEPDENNNPGQTYRASIKDLTVIQPSTVPFSQLPVFPPGSIVLARYPETTTFYKAEVTGLKRDGLKYRLRFEGEEEEDKETEVERLLVLSAPK